MKLSAIKQREPELLILLQWALLDSIQQVVQRTKKLNKNPEEPDFIASLTINFSRHLFEILRTLFPKDKIAVTGVFCHQKPIVDIKLNKDPELGDLLLLFIHKNIWGRRVCNSLLLQAKRTKHEEHRVSVSEQHQLELYLTWPDFIYKRAGTLNGTCRSIVPKSITDGAQYLLIDDPVKVLQNKNNEYPMGCATPDLILTINNPFSTEIVEFLKIKSGRTFEYNAKTSKDDWTKMIWDLLTVTKEKARRKNFIPGNGIFERQSINQMDGACFFSTQAGSQSIWADLHQSLANNATTDPNISYVDEQNFSPSILLIESNEGEALRESKGIYE